MSVEPIQLTAFDLDQLKVRAMRDAMSTIADVAEVLDSKRAALVEGAKTLLQATQWDIRRVPFRCVSTASRNVFS